MKIRSAIIVIVFLIIKTQTGAQTTINYTASTADFTNPERGFYRHTDTHASSHTALNAATLASYKTAQTPYLASYSIQSSLILRVFYLDDFTSSDISSTFLNQIQADFDAVRTAGLKMIVRFAYTNSVDGSTCANWICPPYGDASKAQIYTHINQLKPYISANQDVIACLQMGFIGVWGEQYYTDHFGDAYYQGHYTTSNWEDRTDVLDSLLAAVPTNRMIQVRIPQLKQKAIHGAAAATSVAAMTSSDAYQETAISRIGFHNDCLLSSYTDFGTYNDYGNDLPSVTSATADTTNLKPYLEEDSKYVVVGGETCSEYAPFDDCDADGGTADLELARFHYSYLNSDYNVSVNNGWVGSCMDSIKNKLGYRFLLKSGTYDDEVQNNQSLSIAIDLSNIGYAAPYNERGLELVLRNKSTGTKYYADIDADPRDWTTGEHSIAEDFCIPSGMAIGTYDLLLNLPDPAITLYTNPDYSIQLGNTSVWESATGYNDLGHDIIINATATNATCSTETAFKSLSTYLPVELMFFELSPKASSIVCNWETATEISNKGFYVERSEDAVHFKQIAWLDGNGNSQSTKRYTYEDKTVQSNQRYYYRLLQVDESGESEYSKIQTAIIQKENLVVQVYPNPIGHQVQFSFEKPFTGMVSIVDAYGRPVKQEQLEGVVKAQITTETLAIGTYWLVFENNTERIVKRLIK